MLFRVYTLVAVLFGLLLVPAEATADSYRCGRKIVRTGDTVARLLLVCGEPRFKSSGSGEIKINGVSKRAQVKKWHYKNGSRSLERIVLIYKGEIAAIEVGGR